VGRWDEVYGLVLVQVRDLAVRADGNETFLPPSERGHDHAASEECIEVPVLPRWRFDGPDNLQAGGGSHEKGSVTVRRGDDLRTRRIHIDEDPVILAATEDLDAHLTWKLARRPDPPARGSVLPFSLG